MKKVFKKFRYGEKGFTLIELLVVVAILGVLAAVAVPNVGKFIGRGKNEAYETELHNIQTAVMAMLADSSTGVLDSAQTGIDDMTLVVSTYSSTGDLLLPDYLTGLDSDNTTKATGVTYDFATDGTVTQHTP